MPRWICLNCDREFGRTHQSHVCVPGISVAELLDRHPDWVGDIYTALIDHLHTLGPVHEDAVNVGIFLLSDRKLAEVRPRVRSVQLWLLLAEPVTDSRIRCAEHTGADRYAHALALRTADEVDDQLRGWLTEAYDANTD